MSPPDDVYGDPEFSGLVGPDGSPLVIDKTASWRRKAMILSEALRAVAEGRQNTMIMLIAMLNRFGPEVSFSAPEINVAASGLLAIQPEADAETGEFRIRIVHMQEEVDQTVTTEIEEDVV